MTALWLLGAAALAAPPDRAPLVQVPDPPALAAPGLPPVCATPALLPTMLPSAAPPAAVRAGEKAEREALGGVVEVRRSANFAVKWGAAGAPDEATVAALLDALEQTWAVQVAEMGHPGPVGSGAYLVNVYLEDTGVYWDSGGARRELSGSGASGYFTNDPDGYPMLVMSQFALGEPGYASMVAAHEHYHAVQAATGAYAYSGVSAWYWEATATWASAEVFPEVPDYAIFLFGYALLPWLELDFFDYPDSGALQEFHQYGAFIFPRYLSEHLVDWTVVRDSWVAPDPGGDPLVALATALEARGYTLDEALLGMAAANATWDYVDGAVYAENVALYGPYYADGSAVLARLEGEGTAGWVEVPADWRPHRLGYGLVELDCAGRDAVRIEVEGDAQGDQGTPARWLAAVVERDGQGVRTTALDLGAGAATWEASCEAPEKWLVVAVGAVDRDEGEAYAWRYRVTLDPEAEAGDSGGRDGGDGGDGGSGPALPGEEVACGCAAGGAAASAWVLAPLLALLRRRRAAR